jgi:outer membrane protein TolC
MTPMMSKHTLTGISLIFVVFVNAQINAQIRPQSLADYLRVSIKNHPLIGSAAQAKASAIYSSEAVQKGYYPQIGVASHFIIAPGYDQVVTNGGEFAAQITASYLLYDGGARSYEIQRAGVGVEQGTLNQTRTKADIIYSVSTAFAAAVKEKRELDVVEQDYVQLRDYLQLVQQLHASGQGGQTDVLKTTVELNNVTIDVDARRISYKNSLISLAQAAGLPTVDVTDVDTALLSLSYDTTFSTGQNIDLTSQTLLLKQAEIDAQIAGAKLRPNISLGADAGALTSLPNLQQGFSNVLGASMGLSVTVPFLTFGSIENYYNAAEAKARSISLQNDFARSSLENDFSATRNNIEKANSEIAALQRNLMVAEQNLLLSRARYAGGSGLSLEVLDAIRMVNQMRLAVEEARFEMAMNIFRLSRLNYSGAVQE